MLVIVVRTSVAIIVCLIVMFIYHPDYVDPYRLAGEKQGEVVFVEMQNDLFSVFVQSGGRETYLMRLPVLPKAIVKGGSVDFFVYKRVLTGREKVVLDNKYFK